MNKRRRQGATLGLVAVCVLVIIVIGIGCFFLAKIFGGGREVANATDAGTLNIAKHAMKNYDDVVGVDVTSDPAYSDFKACSDPPNTKITLLTYNRAVAQTLLVAMNAQQEGTGTSTTNAQTVLSNLNALGTALRSKLKTGTTAGMLSYFNQVQNDTRMWGNTGVAAQAGAGLYDNAYMKHGGSTNVYFTNAELAGLTAPTNYDSNGSDKVPPAGSGAKDGKYMAGYTGLSVTGITSTPIMGVPVFPQQNPHLVSLKDFSDPTLSADPDTAGTTPPNAFKVTTKSQDAKSGAFGGAVAAAIVGAVKSTTAGTGGILNYDFPGAVPGGYIEIVNLPGNQLPAGYQAFDNSDNIFNNELYLGPGIEVTGATSPPVFTTDIGALQAWAAFNTSSDTNPGGNGSTGTPPSFSASSYMNSSGNPKNANIYPPTLGYPISQMKEANGSTASAASLSTLLTITNAGDNCLDQLNGTGTLNGACLNNLDAFQNAYHPGPSGSSPADTRTIFSNVDYIKGEVINMFQNGPHMGGPVTAPATPSGLGLYENGFDKTPAPQFAAPIQQTGTIRQLLEQVGGCAPTTLVNQIKQRCYEIKPDAVASDVDALLDTALPMGSDYFIYLQNADPTKKLVISQTAPTTRVSGSTPDGNVYSSGSCNQRTYSLDDMFVDVSAGNSSYDGKGDDNLHDRPYRTIDNGGALQATDAANWTPSSGYQNMLGQLKFQETTTGSETFSRPN